jgi:serine/threonine-protein kinase
MSPPPKSDDPEGAVAPHPDAVAAGKPRGADPAFADTLTERAFSAMTPPGARPFAPPVASGEPTISLPPEAPAPLPSEDDRLIQFAPATILGGRYEIRERLGFGGMGSVYAAHDRLVDQAVALKFLRPSLARDPRELERLRHEVRLAQTVTHVNVARTYTLEESHGILFIVMELLSGQTLAERLRAGPISAPETLVIVDGLLLGLAAAHARGVVHRDIKPTNIILCADGRIVIMDFGLAHVGDSKSTSISGRDTTPEAGQLGGTPGYMAPEIIRGARGDVRGDLYALGVILFEMLAGRAPFAGTSPMDLCMQHVEKELPSLAELQPSVPAEVVRVVERLLDKDPEGRFASADETRITLDPHHGSYGSTPLAQVVIPVRSRWAVGLPVTLVVGLGAAIGLTLILRGNRSPPPSPSPTRVPLTVHAPDAAGRVEVGPLPAPPAPTILAPRAKPRSRRLGPSASAPDPIPMPTTPDPASEKRRRKLDLEE